VILLSEYTDYFRNLALAEALTFISLGDENAQDQMRKLTLDQFPVMILQTPDGKLAGHETDRPQDVMLAQFSIEKKSPASAETETTLIAAMDETKRLGLRIIKRMIEHSIIYDCDTAQLPGFDISTVRYFPIDQRHDHTVGWWFECAFRSDIDWDAITA